MDSIVHYCITECMRKLASMCKVPTLSALLCKVMLPMLVVVNSVVHLLMMRL